MYTQDRVVQAARSWLGTRFCHQGRVRKTTSHKGGVDCLGLLAGIAQELELKDKNGKLLASYDEVNYPHYPDTQHLRQMLGKLLDEIPIGDICPGDMVLLDIQGLPQHMGVVSNFAGGLGLIHSYAPARAVVEHHLDSWWQQRIVTAYRIARK